MSSCYCFFEPKTVEAKVIFKQMQEDGMSTNIQLEGNSGYLFLVHSSILEKVSSDFKKIVAQMRSSNQQTPFYLPYSDEVIWGLLELAYTGATTTNESTVEEQLQMAAHYSITLLTKICSDFLVSTLTVVNWHERYRLGQKFLCKHSLEQMKSFLADNFSRLTNVADLLRVEDMDALFDRPDLDCEPILLLCLLNHCPAYKGLEDAEKTRIATIVSARPVSCLKLCDGSTIHIPTHPCFNLRDC